MTETEARQFLKRLQSLCVETQRECGCEIEINVSEKSRPATKLRWLVIDSISLKIDK